MPNYYNLTTNELIHIAPETFAAWAANGNPKAADYAPLVRNLQDVRGGLTITNNNAATVATHPRVYA